MTYSRVPSMSVSYDNEAGENKIEGFESLLTKTGGLNLKRGGRGRGRG